jgi:heme oxygenase
MLRLRAETAAQHEATEQQVDILRNMSSLERYRDMLSRFYGFYAPADKAFAAHAPGDVQCISKTPLLMADLLSLGMNMENIRALPQCAAIPSMESPSSWWGCRYVIEGASLGGQIIAREAAKKGWDASSGASFFIGAGKDIGPNWREFSSELSRNISTQPEQDACVEAASKMFEAFRNWVGKR